MYVFECVYKCIFFIPIRIPWVYLPIFMFLLMLPIWPKIPESDENLSLFQNTERSLKFQMPVQI